MMYDIRGGPHSGLGAVGPGNVAGVMTRPSNAIPLAAPRPGYPAPVANLNMSTTTPPSAKFAPGLSPVSPQMGQVPQVLRVTRPQADAGAPRMPPPIYQTAVRKPTVPNSPHPLQPPSTPITPVFARPSKSPAPADVKFTETIMRGNSEDHLLPKRGQHGDDFWRRFSMVAKEEKKPSSWLTKTQSGASRLSRWVWVIGMCLLIGAGIGIGLWYYISHTTPSHQLPKAVGGSAGETDGPSTPTNDAGLSSPLVTPTYTLARRDIDFLIFPTPMSMPVGDVVHARISWRNKKTTV